MGISLAAQRAQATGCRRARQCARARLRAPGSHASHGRQSVLGARSHARRAEHRRCQVEGSDAGSVRSHLAAAAQRIVDEDVDICRAIGAAGLELVPQDARILTHCNAGALATAGYGTALGVVRAAFDAGRGGDGARGRDTPHFTGRALDRVGTRARRRARLGDHGQHGGAHLMQRGEIDLVVVGADRIAANGDVANKIGTYGLAVIARAHDLPFYVAAPLSTLDLETPDGSAEFRSRSGVADEIAELAGRILVPDGVPVRHPAFDVTPNRLVTAIVTEAGVARSPYIESLREAQPTGKSDESHILLRR